MLRGGIAEGRPSRALRATMVRLEDVQVYKSGTCLR